MTVAGYPPIRKDGLCACGCGEPLASRKTDRKLKAGIPSGTRLDVDVWLAHLETDPFLTVACARAWFGTETVSERRPRCAGCNEPLPLQRPGNAGPRCRVCAEAHRKSRKYNLAGCCAGCGRVLDKNSEPTVGCMHCVERRRKREARAREKERREQLRRDFASRVSGRCSPGGAPAGDVNKEAA